MTDKKQDTLKKTNCKVNLTFCGKNGEKQEVVTALVGTTEDHVYNTQQLIEDFMQSANSHRRLTIKDYRYETTFCLNMEYFDLAKIEVISG